jgi:DedD protein
LQGFTVLPLERGGIDPILELLVKERLTGAIILVVLIVLLVPELLSGPKGPATPSSAATSAASEEPPLRSYTINLGDDSHPQAGGGNGPSMPQPAGPDQSAASASSEASQSASETSKLEPVPSQVSSGETGKPRQQSDATAAPPPEPAHPVPQVEPKTKSAPARSASSSAPSKTSAAKAVTHVAKANAPATKGTQTTAHPDSRSESRPGPWGVQLGVFASHDNAERLAVEVRLKGFKASVSPVTSGSRRLYRVRVGPAADRAAAQDLQARLKAAGRPAGTVVPFT